MGWEKLVMTLSIIPFAILFVITFCVVIYVMFTRGTGMVQLSSFYSSLCSSCGFVDVTSDMFIRKELTEKIFNIWNKCLWDTDEYNISNIIMKKEKDNTIYLTEIYHHSREGSSPLGQTVLFVELALDVENTYLIREKRYREIKESSNPPGISPPAFLMNMSLKIADNDRKREENPVKNLSMAFSEKFEAYTLEGPEKINVLNDEIQQFIANYKGKYPFINCVKKYPLPVLGTPVPGRGQIVISSRSVSIYALNTSQKEHLVEMFNLSNGLVELLSRIKT
ncbi:MAG: hypothetical protein ABRQ38_17920 [Candidatus Eremiobacterota bacterium]